MRTWQQQLQRAQIQLRQTDTVLARLIPQYGDCTITPHTDYYSELLRSIVSQQLSVKAAASIYKKFISHFDGIVPTPEQILSSDTELLRGLGLSYAKVRYMQDLALHISEGRLDLAHVSTLPNQDILQQLIAVKGIGEWSAHMFMIFSLGRLDVLPTGDLGIRKAMRSLYDLPELPKPRAMNEIALLNNWAPYQSVASWYLWRSVD